MKYLSARLALQSPARFFDTFGPGGDVHYFPDLWTGMGGEFDAAERVSNSGTSVWHADATSSSQEMIVLTFPAPLAGGEAWFIGVVRLSETGCRVFCLERAAASNDEATTMLAELAPHGRMNWGRGPDPTREDFVARVRDILADPGASPLSFLHAELARSPPCRPAISPGATGPPDRNHRSAFRIEEVRGRSC